MKSALHFVGFKGDEYTRARRVFGSPDFVHRQNDARLWGDVAPGDLVVIANGAEDRFHQQSFNDSQWF